MNQENNRIELYQKVLNAERYNKKTKQKYRAYTKDYSTYLKEFFDKEVNTDALYSFLVGKRVYTKSKKDFYNSFACDLDWAKQTQYCPKPITDKERFGTSGDPRVTNGGVNISDKSYTLNDL